MANPAFSSRAAAGADCADCPPKTENIIVIGSEFEYLRSGFQLKCMFLGCGYGVAQGTLRPPGYTRADRTTIAYVDKGYTRWELLNLDYLRDHAGVRIRTIGSSNSFINLLANRGTGADRHVIRNLVMFCHGFPSYFALNYSGPGSDMNVFYGNFAAVPTNAFAPDGKLFSYACRTAMNVGARGPQTSLGQRLANRFDITVRAYKRRTNYGSCIRLRSEHERLATDLKAARVGKEGQRIPLPPDHEAYPHPGLSDGFWPGIEDGGQSEGINNYALWRKNGARALPVEGTSPAGQPTGFFTLTPAGT
ncbi:hypothetical protein [Jannaschia pohangensis]|uniref:Uncharacterized protein n=1 Tax=Jannaschia pohangensis TaxID=390807 RepID=A0A1I3IGJ9_9RHOB|nr:hypothetical protein [Jannaschia pohangensis]SFI47098.1 hypothetical protein SAMN04488095_0961 [Jannaschia pohangensis]